MKILLAGKPKLPFYNHCLLTAAWLKGLQEDFLSAPDQVTLLSCFPYHLSLGCTCWEQKSIGGIGEQMWTRAQRKPRCVSSSKLSFLSPAYHTSPSSMHRHQEAGPLV